MCRDFLGCVIVLRLSVRENSRAFVEPGPSKRDEILVLLRTIVLEAISFSPAMDGSEGRFRNRRIGSQRLGKLYSISSSGSLAI